MIEGERRPTVDAGFPFDSGPFNTAPQGFSACRQHQTAGLDPMQTDENDLPVASVTAAAAAAAAAAATPSTAPTPPTACEEVDLGSTKRKKRTMCVDTSPPPPSLPTAATTQQLNPFSPAVAVGAGGTETATATATATRTIASKTQKLPFGSDESRQTSGGIDLSISCLEGSTMNVPLSGKTVPFRVVKRRGMGISSVVFECEREQLASRPAATVAGVGEKPGDDGPRVVTVKVGCVVGGCLNWSLPCTIYSQCCCCCYCCAPPVAPPLSRTARRSQQSLENFTHPRLWTNF